MKYGIGTYIEELTYSLINFTYLKIIIVSYKNLENKEVTITNESNRLVKVIIPAQLSLPLNTKNVKTRYASNVVRMLTHLIPNKENVVFIMNSMPDLLVARELKKKYSFPIVSVVHFSNYYSLSQGNIEKLENLNLEYLSNDIQSILHDEKELYNISDHIISVNSCTKNFINRFYKIDLEKISVIPNGINYEAFKLVTECEKIKIKHELGFASDDIICLFSGRIDQIKGVGYLIPEFEKACNKNDNLKLVLIGHGNLQEFQSKIKRYFGRIIFTGYIPRDRLKVFYQIADLGLVPSIYEYCPYSVLEMIANQVPIIMTYTDGLNEMLDDSECVFIKPIINSNDKIMFKGNDLSAKILGLTANIKARSNYSERAFKKLLLRNTSMTMADSILNLIENRLNKA